MEEQRTIEAIQADEGLAYAQLDRLQEDSRLLAGRLVSFQSEYEDGVSTIKILEQESNEPDLASFYQGLAAEMERTNHAFEEGVGDLQAQYKKEMMETEARIDRLHREKQNYYSQSRVSEEKVKEKPNG